MVIAAGLEDASDLRKIVLPIFHRQIGQTVRIEGIIKGANFLDGTLFGLGRAAGNCPLELLLGFLKNPKFNIVPILDVIGKHILPMQKDVDWGYHVPYMLSGIRNLHPQAAIKWMDSAEKNDCVAFYDEITEDPE